MFIFKNITFQQKLCSRPLFRQNIIGVKRSVMTLCIIMLFLNVMIYIIEIHNTSTLNYASNEIALFEHQRSHSAHPIAVKWIEGMVDT